MLLSFNDHKPTWYKPITLTTPKQNNTHHSILSHISTPVQISLSRFKHSSDRRTLRQSLPANALPYGRKREEHAKGRAMPALVQAKNQAITNVSFTYSINSKARPSPYHDYTRSFMKRMIIFIVMVIFINLYMINSRWDWFRISLVW